jgi:hypothetical protein
MADSNLVLCAPLCFIASRFGKIELKMLKSSLKDFYNHEEIVNGKEHLIEDVDRLSARLDLSGRPRLPRRTGEARFSADIDDILSLFTFLDEKLPEL